MLDGADHLCELVGCGFIFASIRLYRLIGLKNGSFLRGDYKITQRWAKVFLKALVERNSVMVEVFYMISIPKKYDQKPTILKG